jgi:hypothetical protein
MIKNQQMPPYLYPVCEMGFPRDGAGDGIVQGWSIHGGVYPGVYADRRGAVRENV